MPTAHSEKKATQGAAHYWVRRAFRIDNPLTLRKGIGLLMLSVVAWIRALFGACWTMVFGPGRWAHKALACSICGNLLFVSLVTLGYYLDVAEHTELVAPDCARRAEGVLYFCEAPFESELARIAPNTIYVVSDGVHRAGFEFVSEDMGVLKGIAVMDTQGRPWISASLKEGSLIYNRYPDNVKTHSEVSLIDKDRDGVPDLMVNWELEVSFEPEQNLTWRRIDRE